VSGQRAPRRPAPPAAGGRDLPTAAAVGLGLAALFIVAVMWKPEAALAIVVLVLGLAAVEFFDKVTEKGYQPATIAGILACVGLPLAAWWAGEPALPLVVFLAFVATCATFLLATGIDANPLPNTAITMLGVVWIGVLGSFGALILRWSRDDVGSMGTDTLMLVVVGVALNDIGAYFVGRSVGKRPLRAWVSPAKTVEGFLGGAVLTIAGMLAVGMFDWSDTWTETGKLLWLGVAIAIAAPIGDLTESMFKRNLDIKDFGTLVPGHGGVLDRFDGYLFALPTVYYLVQVLYR
jgi:phosphatidate cytidylyltransferase